MTRIAIPLSKSKTQVFINQAYLDYITAAGYIPECIIPLGTDKDLSKYCLRKAGECDGLILPGGIDIDPLFYGEDNIASNKTDPAKDNFERMLFYAFAEAQKPIFGICRGFQIITREYLRTNGRGIETTKQNTFLEYYQHMSEHNDVVKLQVERSQPTSFADAETNLLYTVDSGRAEKDTRIPINSIHHQALALVGPKITDPRNVVLNGDYKDVKIAAWKQHDSLKPSGVVIEAINFGHFFKGSKVIGVQWHPEELKDYNLLHNIFGTAKTNDDKQLQGSVSAGKE